MKGGRRGNGLTDLAYTRSGGDTWLVSDDNMQWPQKTLLARLPLAWALERLGGD